MSSFPINSGIVQVTEDGEYVIDSSYLDALAASRRNLDGALANGGGCAPMPAECTPCGTPQQLKCQICWGMSLNCETNELTISVVNSTPLLPVTFRIWFPNHCGHYDVHMVLDTKGIAQRKIFLLSGPGDYKVEVINCSCLVSDRSKTAKVKAISCAPACTPCPTSTIDTVECAPITSQIFSNECGQVGSSLCANSVTMTPSFQYATIASGQQIGLRITVCNNNPIAIDFQLPPLTLPAGLFGTIKIPKTSIGGQSCEDFDFILNVNGEVGTSKTLVLGSGTGLYVCKGGQYSASGGQTTVQVTAPTGLGACGLSIESFAWTPAEIFNGGNSQLCLVLKNTGSNPITNIVVPAIAGPAGFSGAPISGVIASLAAGATTQLCTTGVITHTANVSQTLSAIIPAGAISFICFGSTQNAAGATAPIVVRAETGDLTECLGLLYADRYAAESCNITLTIEGGIPNATYHVKPRLDGVVTTWFTIPADSELVTDSNGDGFITVFATAPITLGPQPLAFRLEGPNGCSGNYLYYIDCSGTFEPAGGFD